MPPFRNRGFQRLHVHVTLHVSLSWKGIILVDKSTMANHSILRVPSPPRLLAAALTGLAVCCCAARYSSCFWYTTSFWGSLLVRCPLHSCEHPHACGRHVDGVPPLMPHDCAPRECGATGPVRPGSSRSDVCRCPVPQRPRRGALHRGLLRQQLGLLPGEHSAPLHDASVFGPPAVGALQRCAFTQS
jgi:hypothetical protein